MHRLYRLLIGLLLAAAPLQASDPARIAIIDTAWDTRKYLPALKANGVQVIGRYYARCPQEGLAEKRLAFSDEAAEILRHGMGILSIYQYRSSSKHKFDGQRKGKNGRLLNLPDTNCAPSATGRSAKAEARLDVKAALEQARQVGQPQGSAIYFAVDFNFSRSDKATKTKLLTYFKTVRKALTRGGYRLGAYGDGDALSVLQRAGLIDFAWIMASAGFPGSSAFHRTGRWNIYQTQVDPNWFASGAGGCGKNGLPLDVNVQNPAMGNDIGLWGRDGRFVIPPARSQAIFSARRFVCNGDARLRKTRHSRQNDLVMGRICRAGHKVSLPKTLKFLRPIRVGRIYGKLVQVDINEDGKFDGWTWAGNLTGSFSTKPNYLYRARQRAAARCR